MSINDLLQEGRSITVANSSFTVFAGCCRPGPRRSGASTDDDLIHFS